MRKMREERKKRAMTLRYLRMNRLGEGKLRLGGVTDWNNRRGNLSYNRAYAKEMMKLRRKMSASVTIAMIFTVKMRNDRAFVRSAKAGVVLALVHTIPPSKDHAGHTAPLCNHVVKLRVVEKQKDDDKREETIVDHFFVGSENIQNETWQKSEANMGGATNGLSQRIRAIANFPLVVEEILRSYFLIRYRTNWSVQGDQIQRIF
uniref:Uncharacterized protein n=1 Tax=Pristionchus pacificus TaxID=54126 RepID=A0A2A6C2B1_PRIPA|eukprot:PDM72249.1 hypothetical protein PRIPAC_38683 [Pristionchus pacificus]